VAVLLIDKFKYNLLRWFAPFSPGVTPVIGSILDWTAVSGILIVCVEAVAAIGLVAFGEIKDLLQEVKKGKRAV
jgi:hypothetical protein